MIHSLLTTDNSINSTESLREWIEQRNREVQVDVKLIPFITQESSFLLKEFMLKQTMEKHLYGINPS